MRSSSVVMIVLLVGLVFAIFSSIMVDFRGNYDNDIDNSSWTGFYNEEYTTGMDNDAKNLTEALQNIGTESNFFTKIGAGVVAITKAVLLVPKMIFNSLVNAGKILIEAQNIFGLPMAVMVFINLGLAVAVIFALVNWWHSKDRI